MSFLVDKFKGTEPYVPGEQPADIQTYIKLNTNESPFPPSPLCAETLKSFDPNALRLYPSPVNAELVKAVADYHDVAPENVFAGNGSDEILALCFLAFCDDKKGIVFPDLTYGFYQIYDRLASTPLKTIPLKEDLTIDVNDYINVKSSIVLANPNAQTGLALTAFDIEKIVKSNPDYPVIIDEAYVDFGAETVLPLVKKYDNLLVVRTASKSRSLAGERIAYAVGSKELINDLLTVKDNFNSYNVDRLASALLISSLKDETYFKTCTRTISEQREELKLQLKALGFTVTDSKANFVLAFPPEKITAKEMYLKLKNRKILVRYLGYPRTENAVRITVGSAEQNQILIENVKEILEK